MESGVSWITRNSFKALTLAIVMALLRDNHSTTFSNVANKLNQKVQKCFSIGSIFSRLLFEVEYCGASDVDEYPNTCSVLQSR